MIAYNKEKIEIRKKSKTFMPEKVFDIKISARKEINVLHLPLL